MKLPALLLLTVLPASAQYSVHREGEVIRLEDARNQTKVLQFPFANMQEYKAGRGLSGIPFLAPWANRLDEPAFYANGKKYSFNLDLGNVRPGAQNHPIHGFLTDASQWEVVEASSDAN